MREKTSKRGEAKRDDKYWEVGFVI